MSEEIRNHKTGRVAVMVDGRWELYERASNKSHILKRVGYADSLEYAQRWVNGEVG